jgi:hypothetical protein
MTTETEERLKKMRFWLIGTFLILAAAIVAFGIVVPGLLSQTRYLVGLVVAAALTVASYYGYRLYLGHSNQG